MEEEILKAEYQFLVETYNTQLNSPDQRSRYNGESSTTIKSDEQLLKQQQINDALAILKNNLLHTPYFFNEESILRRWDHAKSIDFTTYLPKKTKLRSIEPDDYMGSDDSDDSDDGENGEEAPYQLPCYKYEHIKKTIETLHQRYWVPILLNLQHQAIAYLSDLSDLYSTFYYEIYTFYESQQLCWNRSPSSLIIYQLIHYQCVYNNIIRFLEHALFSFSLIPSLLEYERLHCPDYTYLGHSIPDFADDYEGYVTVKLCKQHFRKMKDAIEQKLFSYRQFDIATVFYLLSDQMRNIIVNDEL